ncbi:MAG: hypothetical protein QOJ02_2825, partial [Acidobacteriota bacterium]|nr:hypothetical protein [Acidobacteriota bacterium]
LAVGSKSKDVTLWFLTAHCQLPTLLPSAYHFGKFVRER